VMACGALAEAVALFLSPRETIPKRDKP